MEGFLFIQIIYEKYNTIKSEGQLKMCKYIH